jgi:hypothetical protein
VPNRLSEQAGRDEVAASMPEDRTLPTRAARLRLVARERADAIEDMHAGVT